MNLIENGNFESGTPEPWTAPGGVPSKFKIVSENNKKWLQTDGFNGPANGSIQQIIPKSDDLWDIHFRLTITVKAVPTGATVLNDAQSDNDVNRLNGELVAYMQLYPQLPGISQSGGRIYVSVKEQTFTHRFTLKHFASITHGRLLIVNWGGGDTDKADILITDIKLEAVDPAVDPKEPAENVRTIDLSSIELGPINVSPMKEVK